MAVHSMTLQKESKLPAPLEFRMGLCRGAVSRLALRPPLGELLAHRILQNLGRSEFTAKVLLREYRMEYYQSTLDSSPRYVRR